MKDKYGFTFVRLRKGIKTYLKWYEDGTALEVCDKHDVGWKEGSGKFCNECVKKVIE